MRKRLMSLCWFVLTVVSMAQFGSAALLNAQMIPSTPNTMVGHSHDTKSATMAHCTDAKAGIAHTTADKTCANALCMAVCAAHCMSILPVQTLVSHTLISEKPSPTGAYKPPYSIATPDTPPPKFS